METFGYKAWTFLRLGVIYEDMTIRALSGFGYIAMEQEEGILALGRIFCIWLSEVLASQVSEDNDDYWIMNGLFERHGSWIYR